MKRIYIVLLGIIFYGTTAYADEMRIDLESGNTLLIQYTGTINGVSLQGSSDTITALKTERAGEQTSPVQSAPAQAITTKPNEQEGAKSNVRFGWTDPKMED